jgi:putative (di)nucleoside polyphosphate hydrolase
MADRTALPYRRGVGIMLLNERNEVFVAQRIDMPSDAWQMPQGGIDEGESPLDAAWREMAEEIGTANAKLLARTRGWLRYDLPEELAATLWKGRYRGQEQKWFAFRFVGQESEINIATDRAEFSTWRWAAMASLPDLIVPFKRQLYVDVVAQFGHLIRSQPRKGRRHA